MKNRLFLFSKKNSHNINKKIELRYSKLLRQDILHIKALQKKVFQDLKEEGQEELLVDSSQEEIEESISLDYIYGLFDKEKLIAFCMAVLPRQTERNLSNLLDENKKDKDQYNDYLTFDTILVDPNYRGYGIQSFYLNELEKLAMKKKTRYIIATVSLNNEYSKRNFLNHGFVLKKITTLNIGQYKGAKRGIFVKKLE